MDSLFQDLRYGVRMLIRNTGFAAIAVITLALGIGANAAIFSVVNTVLLRPLPFPQPERVVAVASERSGMPGSASYPDFFDWRAQAQSFAALASYRDTDFTLSGNGEPQHLNAEVVAADFFTALGLEPTLGRGFVREDEKPGTRVVVLSHRLWQSRFGADPGVVGRTITLNDRPYTVIGVAPAGFDFPSGTPQLWTTLALDATVEPPDDKPTTVQRGAHFLNVVGRLKPGSTLAQADAEMNVIAAKLAQQYPDTNKTRPSAVVRRLHDELVGNTRLPLLVLLAAVGCVLLIACVNVANLLLARATSRRREIAIRAALGGGRGRVMRQLLTESVLLALIGGGIGLAFAVWLLPVLLRFAPETLPRIAEIGTDARALAFTVVLSVLTGLVFGVVPAVHASRTDLVQSLRQGDRAETGRGHHWRSGLVIAETAIGLVLLVAAGLLMRTFSRLVHTDPGFDPKSVITLTFDLPAARYNTEKQVQFYRDLLERLNRAPGIEAAATTWTLPLSGSEAMVSFQVEGRPVAKADEPSATIQVISPRYFETLRMPVLRGRDFNEHDTRSGAPAVIVSESFARKFLPGENPIGRRIKPGLSDSNAPGPWREIVGVVPDIRQRRLTVDPLTEYYLPYSQAMVSSFPLCIRTSGDPTAIVSAVRNVISSMDPQVPVYNVRPLEEYVASSLGQQRFNSFLLGAFAGFALLLTMVGLYGVMAYSVVQHTRDIGVRMALGASAGDVLRIVLWRGLALAAIGIAIGLVAAGIATRWLATLLYGVRPLDVPTFVAVSALLAAVSSLASYIPARRATRVDPMVALRYE